MTHKTNSGLHDSGYRRTTKTGAQRDRAEGKGRYDLLPVAAIDRLAKQLEKGALKYGDKMPVTLETGIETVYNLVVCNNYEEPNVIQREGMLLEDYVLSVIWTHILRANELHAIATGLPMSGDYAGSATTENLNLRTQNTRKGKRRTSNGGAQKTRNTKKNVIGPIIKVLPIRRNTLSIVDYEHFHPSDSRGKMKTDSWNINRESVLSAKRFLTERPNLTIAMKPISSGASFADDATRVLACLETMREDLLGQFGILKLRQLRFSLSENDTILAETTGDRNWEKGMPLSWFMDSGLRHLFKHLAGMRDEDHLAAALFNISGLIWTENEITEGRLPADLNDLPKPRS